MEAEFLTFIFNLFLFIGVIIAFKDRKKISALVSEIDTLKKLIRRQSDQIKSLSSKLTHHPADSELTSSVQSSETQTNGATEPNDNEATSDNQNPDIKKIVFQSAIETPVDSFTTSAQVSDENEAGNEDGETHSDSGESPFAMPLVHNKSTKTAAKPKSSIFTFDSFIKGNGLLWLGGIILAFGGVFLAKYSIEAGLLPPSVRVVLGSLFGVALIVGAEYLNKNKERFNIQSPYISAAIASGGLITCFSMTLVAFDFYQFISANVAFALLAVIAFTATSLSLRFGPLLAAIGLIGAYAVPALVSTGSNNIFALLLYVSLVSGSAIWVANIVNKGWLWWQSFIAHSGWLFAALLMSKSSDFGIILVFSIISIYLYVIANILGWKLEKVAEQAMSIKALLMPRKEQIAIIFPLVVASILLLLYPTNSNIFIANIVIGFCLFIAALRHSALDTWPFLALFFALFSFTLFKQTEPFSNVLFPFNAGYLFIQVASIVGMGFCIIMLRKFPYRHSYLLLLAITPITLFGMSYALSPKAAETFLYPLWSVELLFIGAISAYFSIKTTSNIYKVTYLVLANATLALCLTMLLGASTLTLALATQIATMSYLSWKYQVRLPDWVYKVAILAVVTRLTLAPWLDSYSGETILSLHWTVIIYPVVIAITWFAAKYNPSPKLNAWFSGVILHLVALFVTTETSYLLVGHYPDLSNLSYKESILLSMNWLLLSGVYNWRRKLANTLRAENEQPSKSNLLYLLAGSILLGGAALLHLDLSLASNPFIVQITTDQAYLGKGVVNWLFLLWALPACALMCFVKLKLLPEHLHKVLLSIAGIFMFLFINGEIRLLFNDGQLLWQTPLPQAELYTYSIVWLLISTVTIFVAQNKQLTDIRNLGFSMLALVILKAFLADMSHLEGLYRALSFIGLGLSLVGIGWLFQRMQREETS